MMKFKRIALAVMFLAFLLCLSGPAVGQEKKDNGKIVGEWKVEVYGGGEYYYLTMTIVEQDAKLSGSMSEKDGMFEDAPLANVEFDGQTLSFEITVTSPPDGLEKTWEASLTVGEDKLEGSITNDQVGSVSASATREKK